MVTALSSMEAVSLSSSWPSLMIRQSAISHWDSTDIRQAALVIMMVADALVPNRLQDISNHHADLNGTTVCRSLEALQIPGPCLNIKTVFPRYGDYHVKDKTVVRPCNLKHWDPYTGKTTSLYWDGPWSLENMDLAKFFIQTLQNVFVTLPE